MKIVYSTNLFYRYLVVVLKTREIIEYTECSFYEKLYQYENRKFKKYPDREEFETNDGYLFIRKYAYFEIPDYIKIKPFHFPEEVYQQYPETEEELENVEYWHNIHNNIGKKGSWNFEILPLNNRNEI